MSRTALSFASTLACAALASTSATVSAPARADLRDAAARVEHEWRASGASVERKAPRFMSDDETITVTVDGDADGRGDCTTIAIVGARGMSFHGKVVDPMEDDERSEHGASVAGVLEIARCGGEPLRQVSLATDAGRGAIEMVVARSHGSVASIGTILPERTGGVLPTPSEAGGLPPLPLPEKRAEIAEARAVEEGARAVGRSVWQANGEGTGESHVVLEAGCHRIELFAVDPRAGHAGRRFRLDLDAELHAEDGETMLARDRTDAPDARLEICVGGSTPANVLFAGSLPNAKVIATHVAWTIPARLPITWGSDARARMARVLLAHHVPPLKSEAVALAEGPSGVTPVPFEVEPGACYLAVAAVEHGHARGVGLRVLVGARAPSDDRGASDEAALVSFCARDERRVRVEVDARGVGISWGLALFRLSSGTWGAAP